ncbi:MAG: hypothetical protein QOF74_1658 [Caballeronia mineralivorans]|jgi:hypothetical protein|nr:hypothetical protein [Caballeronia mineralivorans]
MRRLSEMGRIDLWRRTFLIVFCSAVGISIDYRATGPPQAIFEMISTKLSTETVDNFADV